MLERLRVLGWVLLSASWLVMAADLVYHFVVEAHWSERGFGLVVGVSHLTGAVALVALSVAVTRRLVDRIMTEW